MKDGNIRIDRIIRTNRKTVSLIVNSQGELIVRAPLHVSDSFVKELVESKAAWIARKMEEVKTRRFLPEKQFVEGEPLLYIGRSYPLFFGDNLGINVEISDKLVVSCGKDDVRDVLIHWYRQRALETITERCAHFSRSTGLRPSRIKISNAGKRWGSCSSRGNLNFAWRLVMAPLEVIDYVVVHELCHLREMNHSQQFWARVSSIMPDYEPRRKWLQENGRYLYL
jgi:predicted metal-dependent hydrolase